MNIFVEQNDNSESSYLYIYELNSNKIEYVFISWNLWVYLEFIMDVLPFTKIL